MQLKKVGAVLAGAALLGATFAGAAAGAELDVPERDFFIDETTGLNNCLIVVGSGAAAADVVSASYVAAEVGTMAYTEEVMENWEKPGVIYAAVPNSATPANPLDGTFEENVDNYYATYDAIFARNGYNDLYFDDFRDALNYGAGTPVPHIIPTVPYGQTVGPESWVVLPYTCVHYRDAYKNKDWNGVSFNTYAGTFSSPAYGVKEVWAYISQLSLGVDFPENPVDPSITTAVSIPEAQWWDYDVYIDPRTTMSTDLDYSVTTTNNGNFLIDTGCSYEAITVDFSLRDVECSAEFCTACLAACDQDGLFTDLTKPAPGTELTDLLFECQTYPNVYPRHYWGSPEAYANAQWEFAEAATPNGHNYDVEVQNYCDPVGGIEYRAIVDGFYSKVKNISWCAVTVPSSSDDRKSTGDALNAKTTPPSEAYLVCNESWPQCVELYCAPCDVFFLGEHYDALTFGTDVQGYDFMFYGTPEWYVEEKLAVGESKDYNGWNLAINDLGIYENKAYITITDPDGVAYDYMVVINSYTSQIPSAGDGDNNQCLTEVILQDSEYEVACPCGDTAGDNEENDTIAFVQRVFDAYDLCGENEYGTIDYGWYKESGDCAAYGTFYPNGEVVFAVKFVKTMIGAAGNYVVEYHAYDLVDFGVLKEQIYNGPCETPIDPAISAGEFDWYFDVIPKNGISISNWDGTVIDLDNMPSLYAEGNPNFDIADALKIYSEYVYAADWASWSAAKRNYLGNYFEHGYDSNGDVSFSGYTESRPGTDRQFLIPKCAPMLELWLATPVELAGLCEDELIIELEDCEGDNYFTLEVDDTDHTDYRIDGSITLSRTVLASTETVKTYVDIDSTMLVKLDENIDATLKEAYNLILIGGPVANMIVSELVDLGETTLEMWETSEGDVVMLEDTYAVGKDVLIVAGADRDMTAAAAIALIDAL